MGRGSLLVNPYAMILNEKKYPEKNNNEVF